MASIAIFDPLATPQKVLSYLDSISSPDYAGRTDVVIQPDISALAGIPIIYWKHVAGAIVEMTVSEKSAVDAAIIQAAINAMRSGGISTLVVQSPAGIVLRAFADILKDEFNIIRQWITDFKADVAAATTLADLKTRVAADPDLPDRTLAQLKTAIQDKISSGTVDV